jgi:hypothetical protein
MTDDSTIEAGRAAWQRVSKREIMQFDDWCAIGRALIVIRTQVMMEANLNKPFGGKYNRVIGAALAKHGLAGISTGERIASFGLLRTCRRWKRGAHRCHRRSCGGKTTRRNGSGSSAPESLSSTAPACHP